MCADIGQGLFLEQWFPNFHVLYSNQKKKKKASGGLQHLLCMCILIIHFYNFYDPTDMSQNKQKMKCKRMR